MKSKILVLNKYYYPIAIGERNDIFTNIWSGSMSPLDVHYEEDSNGCIDHNNISYYTVIHGPKEWRNMEIRPYDEYIQTVKGPIRIPTVVICNNYERIPNKGGLFPTKGNILKRDAFVCQYTNIKLTKETQSIDHIFPVSKCYDNPNTWENQVACHRELNTWKADRLPEECFIKDFDPICPLLKEWKATYNKKTLKLLKYPTKPKNPGAFVFSDTMESWNAFLKNI